MKAAYELKSSHVCEKRSKKKKKMKRVTVSSIVVVAVPGVPGLRVFRTLFSCPIHPLAALTMAFNLSTLAESNQHYRHCFELLNDSVISLFLTGFASISSIPTFHSPLATFTIVKASFTIRSTTQTSVPVRSLLRTTNDNKFLCQGLRSVIP